MDDEIPNVTWPRSQLPPKLLSALKNKEHLYDGLNSLRKISEYQDDDEFKSNLNSIYSLMDINEAGDSVKPLEALKLPNTIQPASRAGSRSNLVKNFRRNARHHQPIFGSMVMIAKSDVTSSKKSIQYVNSADGSVIEQAIDTKEPVKHPLYAKIISVTILAAMFFLYITTGTVILKNLDPVMNNRTTEEVVLVPFQLTSTIGWGNQGITDHSAQLFVIFYSLCGIPLCMTTISQIGRWIFDGFTSDWIYNTAVLSYTPGMKPPVIQFPVIRALNLLIAHSLLGILIFNEYIQNFDIVESLYFTYVAIALTGFGDLAPHPKDLFQSFIVCVFLMFGVTLTAVIHISFSYYIQSVFFIHFKNWIYGKYKKKQARNKINSKITV